MSDEVALSPEKTAAAANAVRGGCIGSVPSLAEPAKSPSGPSWKPSEADADAEPGLGGCWDPDAKESIEPSNEV
jgi:hypothetical protein